MICRTDGCDNEFEDGARLHCGKKCRNVYKYQKIDENRIKSAARKKENKEKSMAVQEKKKKLLEMASGTEAVYDQIKRSAGSNSKNCYMKKKNSARRKLYKYSEGEKE